MQSFPADRDYRRQGIARVAVSGALQLIAQAGLGSWSRILRTHTDCKKTSASFLYNATRSMFGQAGFAHIRSEGKNHSVMRKTVPARRMRSGQ